MTDKIKIVFAPGALEQIESQEDLDIIADTIKALANGAPLPDNVEVNHVGELSHEDIIDIMAGFMHLNDADFKRLHTALQELDLETMAELMEGPKPH